MEFLIIFIEGVASFLSPCVLPMLPMYVSYFAGQDKRFKKNYNKFFRICFRIYNYFCIIRYICEHIRKKLITANSRYINIIFGIIIIIFGMHYMGILNIKILNKSKGIQKKQKTN